MKLLNFTLLKLTLCLSVGIGIAHFIKIPLNISLAITFVSVAALAIVFYYSRNRFEKTLWFGIITLVTTFAIGILVYNVHNQSNFTNHYSRFLNIADNTENLVTMRIREKLKPGNFYDKYIVDILKLNETPVSGKFLLNVQVDSTMEQFKIDDIIMTSVPLEELKHPLNPNQFDYKNYLEKQYVYHQVFAKNQELIKISSKRHTFFGFADQLRETINVKLKASHFNPDELAIINALLLGQRQDISEEIYNSYVRAGAIHILAVSGLHVGIVLLLLNFVLKPIEYFKHGKLIKALIILFLLWGFALVAGLSSSVTRAVAMFSIVAIAMHWKRPTNVYNTLVISIFILLLFKPMFLFDVGFQLSYLAVLAIVAIQPLLYRLWKPKLKLVDFFWNIFTVTLAAQIGIVPVSLYYFHQFPGLFFVSNLAIIPFLGVILALGIITIFLALLNMLPSFMASIYGEIISTMNDFVDWVSRQEQFLLKDIPITILQVVVSYLAIITLVKFYKNKTFNNLRLFLVSILLFQSILIYNTYTNSANTFIIFHKSRSTIIGEKTNSILKIYHNLDSLSIDEDNVIKNYKIGIFIREIEQDSVKSIYQINSKILMVIDSLGIYNVKTFRPNYVLLRNSPKINLNRLMDSINPEYVIADGSNYQSYVDLWKRKCIIKKLPFHSTSEKGAFIIK